MKIHDVVILLALGLIIWVLGTIYYAGMGSAIFETTPSRYWRSFVLSPILSAILCIGILRSRNIPQSHWTSAMLLLAVPGMIGEAIVLSNLSRFMLRLHATSGGKYGAFLFAAYALALGIAEIVNLRTTP
jgi:hypothetical protein